MKKITIKKIVYENFRAQSRSIEFSDKKTIIKGRNGSGKSTVFDAIMWLLTGYDMADRLNYKLFDDRKKMTYENSVKAKVTAIFSVDGVDTELSRSAQQRWQREKGSTEYTKAASDDYRFSVDGIDIAATRFTETVEQIFGCGGQKLKMMLNLDFWLMLDWRILRQNLSDIVGEISEGDMQGDYSLIQDDLKTTDVQTLKKDLKDKATGKHTVKQKDGGVISYEERAAQLAAQILSMQTLLPDVSECDAADERLVVLKAKANELLQRIAGLRSVSDKDALNVTKKQNEYDNRKRQYENMLYEDKMAIQNAYAEDKVYNQNLESRRSMLTKQMEDMQNRVAQCNARREELLKKHKELKSLAFNSTCPLCGAPLDGEQRVKAREKFDEDMKNNIDAVIGEGKRVSEVKQQAEEEIARLKAEISELNPKDLAVYQEKVAEYKRTHVAWDVTEECKGLLKEIEDLKAAEDESEITALLSERSKIEAEIIGAAAIAAKRKEAEDGKQKISELKAEGRRVAQLMADTEKKALVCEEYINERAEIVRSRLEALLPKGVEIEMQKMRKDGTYEPSCQVLFKDTNALVLNTEKKRFVSLSIAMLFRQFYDVELPTFFDNSNDFDSEHLPKTKGQIVYAYVSDGDFEVGNG